jgi:hypothetical protein
LKDSTWRSFLLDAVRENCFDCISTEGGLYRMGILSTKDVRQRAQKALEVSPFFALRELHVEQDGDTLLICGRVTSFYHKQLAQEAVRAAAEGLEVVNSIDVR